MSDNRAIVYFDASIESWVYRASSVGKSIRCLTSARQGFDPLPPPDYLVAAADAGNRYEGIVKSKLRAMGYKIAGEQGSIDYEVKPGLIIRGHLDGRRCLSPDDNVDRVLEVKSMSQRVFTKWITGSFDTFPEYAAQLTVYMHAEGQLRGGTVPEATYAVINRDTDEMDIRTIKTPPLSIQAIVQKVALSEQFAEMNQLPVCDSASQYSCPYDYLCDKNEILFEEIEEGKEAMIRHLGDQYVEIKKAEKLLEDRMVTVKAELATALGVREEVKVPQYTITNKIPKPRKNVDLVGLRQLLGDDLDRYLVDQTPSRSVRVYPRGKKENSE